MEGRIDDEGTEEGLRMSLRVVMGDWRNTAAHFVFVLLVVDEAKGASLGEGHHSPHHPRMNSKIAEEERRWDLERRCSILARSRN